MSQNYLAAVRDQYEDYPYPMRYPDEERMRMHITLHESLAFINYYGFGGRQSFRKGFRALLAGGGTGDALIMLAEQLRESDARIVYVDISENSMAIAKQRAEIRGLKNIEWRHGSLLDVAGMNIGKFDYINCTGVLHHLADPDAGLRALAGVLKEDGVMGLMVYGAVGRAGVYHLQTILKTMTRHIANKQEKVEIAKKLLANLPKTNWFSLGFETFKSALGQQSDHEIYDLLFNAQDRAYTVGEIYNWLGKNQLVLIDFLVHQGLGKIRYEPSGYFGAGFEKSFEGLSVRQRHETAEILVGNLVMHHFYASKRPIAKPQPQDPEMVPFLANHFCDNHEAGYRYLRETLTASAMDRVKFTQPGTENFMIMPKGPFTQDLMQAIDGMKTVDEIIGSVLQKVANPAMAERVVQDWLTLFAYLNYYDWLLLRHKSVPPFLHFNDLQKRMMAEQGIV